MAANLTDVAVTTRKIIRYGIYLVVILIIARILFGFGSTAYKRLNPEGPPPPTVGFGRLEAINFPEGTQGFDGLTFRLETLDGNLPVLPNQLKVYFIPGTTSSLFSLDDAKAKASGLGFRVQPVELSETIYRFNNNDVPSSMEINIITGIFSSSYNLAFDPTPLQNIPPTPDDAAKRSRAILISAKSMPEDLANGTMVHEFLAVEGQNLVSTTSRSEAELIKISVFRANIDEIPVKTSDPNEGNVWLILSGAGAANRQLIASQFHYYFVDYGRFETYPLKTSQQAWEEFNAGNAYVAGRGLNKEGEVAIRKIYLAYYDPNLPSQYFQPIIVFEGDNGFSAYVSAVTSDFYGEVVENPAETE